MLIQVGRRIDSKHGQFDEQSDTVSVKESSFMATMSPATVKASLPVKCLTFSSNFNYIMILLTDFHRS
jgi:hypothetical protein